MRKVLLASAAFMVIAGAVYAQPNTATALQNGSQPTISQTQTGNYLTSTVSQVYSIGMNFGAFGGTRQTSTGSITNQTSFLQKESIRSSRAFVTQSEVRVIKEQFHKL